MRRRNRRISIGFGYIGFGNKQSNFNQKNENPFTATKERLHAASHYHFQLDFKHEKLSKADKELIKSKIRKMEKRKTITSGILTVLIMIVLFFVLKALFLNAIENQNTI